MILLFGQAVDSLAETIFVTTKWGNAIETFDENGNRSLFATGLKGPQGIAFDQSGTLYVADSLNNRILKYSGATPSVFVGGLNAPRGITFDSSGNLFVANYWDYNITRVAPNGEATIFVENWWDHADDLAFDQNGNLFVASSHGNYVAKYSPEGTKTILPLAGLSLPQGLAFDQSGNLFVASGGNNIIYKVDVNGVQTVFASSGLVSPQGLAFDSSGNLYVANSWILNTLVKFDPNGNQLWSAPTLEGPVFIAIIPEPSPLALLVSAAFVGFVFRRLGYHALHRVDRHAAG